MNQQQLLEELSNYRINATATTSITGNPGWVDNYWKFREQAWEFQKEHNISGLVNRSITIDGSTYEVLEADSQLTILPGDILLLRKQKSCLTSIFLTHCYDIFEHLQGLASSDFYPYVQIPVSRVHQRVNKSDWAELTYSESDNELHLMLGCGNDPSLSIYWGNKYTHDNYSFVAPLGNKLPVF